MTTTYKFNLLPIPSDLSPFWTKEAERRRARLINDGDFNVQPDGHLTWKSNDRPIPMDVFRDAYVEAPATQEAACKASLEAFLASYNPPPVTDEQRFEMRAAFGPGVEVVNIITGRRTRT